jgi:serine/threonine protein kinase
MYPLKPLDPPMIGRYLPVGRLGEGGMGEVFLGRSPEGFEAVKLIRAERAGDPQFRGRFKREVETAQKAGGCYTAPLIDADPEAERPWDRTTGRELATLSGHRGVVRSVAFGPDGTTLAGGGADATIRLRTIR